MISEETAEILSQAFKGIRESVRAMSISLIESNICFNRLVYMKNKLKIARLKKLQIFKIPFIDKMIYNIELKNDGITYRIEKFENELRKLKSGKFHEQTLSEYKDEMIGKIIATKGAMILDGYEPEDSCIKFMNELIDEL